jgi:hypothetical protein
LILFYLDVDKGNGSICIVSKLPYQSIISIKSTKNSSTAATDFGCIKTVTTMTNLSVSINVTV